VAASQVFAHQTATEPAVDFDAIVIGAGVSGLYQLYKLHELGLKVRAGGRHRYRRHVVLEPLSRRPFRF
jgi:ribulose 1,5-bisphosphate synthetase/thiazole synthase